MFAESRLGKASMWIAALHILTIVWYQCTLYLVAELYIQYILISLFFFSSNTVKCVSKCIWSSLQVNIHFTSASRYSFTKWETTSNDFTGFTVNQFRSLLLYPLNNLLKRTNANEWFMNWASLAPEQPIDNMRHMIW